MRQLFQDYRTGELHLEDVPAPVARPGHVVVRTRASAVSVGTERQTMELANKSLVGKAFARPDLVKQVVAKVRMEGLGPAWRASQARLDVPVALGYSCAGEVVEVGEGVAGVRVGDRVACSGSNFAGHAELVTVPASLVVPLPPGVSDEHGSFAALGAIALHASRLARAKPGEPVLVVGLGLLGQTAVQILAAWGLRVFGVDAAQARVDLALTLGAHAGSLAGEGALEKARLFAGPSGFRAAVIFAATPSNEPLQLAADACGEKGRIVAAGLVGLEVPRRAFFEKELELVVSRAWGAGSLNAARPEPVAEGDASAQENLAAFVDLVAAGKVRLDPIVTHRYPFERAKDAYDLILHQREPYFGVVLRYDAPTSAAPARTPLPTSRAGRAGRVRVGVVGAGAFARGVVLPLLARQPELELRVLATHRPVEARAVASRFGFASCVADAEAVVREPDIDAVVILTRHGSHAPLAAAALDAGKKVFLEKPLATTLEGLDLVRKAHARAEDPFLMVGFNRRFAPTTRFLAERFGAAHGPLAIHATVNAGAVEASSWVNDPQEGGGRLVGEACHFVDLAQALAGARPVRVHATPLGTRSEEDVHLALSLADGSLASILYTARGARGHLRERVEVLGEGAVGVIENFRRASHRRGLASPVRAGGLSVDRGHAAQFAAFARALARGEPSPTSFDDHVATTLATFAAVESLRTGLPVGVPS